MNVPFPGIGIHPVEFILTGDLPTNQGVIPAGTKIKIWSTEFHKWILIPEGTTTTDGQYIMNRLFRY